MLEETRQETRSPYPLVLNRGCAHLFEEVSRLLQPRPHVRVVVDRRYPPAGHAPPPPPYPAQTQPVSLPPRLYHLVIRRDCAHLYEDLAPLFAGRPDIQVLVDRRNRARMPPPPILPAYREQRQVEPPAWLA